MASIFISPQESFSNSIQIMRLLKIKPKPFEVSNERVYGAKIFGMHLKSKEFAFLNRLFPQSDYDIRFVESFYGQHRQFIGAITSTLGIYLILGACYTWFLETSPIKVAMLAGLVSYTILTGLGLYVKEETLRQIDETISLMLTAFIERTKYLIKRNLCLADKSAHRVKWNYIVFPLLFFMLIVPMGIQVIEVFGIDQIKAVSQLVNWYDSFEGELLQSFESNKILCSLQIVFIFLTYSSPRVTEERTLREGVFDKVRKLCTFFNVNIFIGFIVTHIAPIVLLDVPLTKANIVKYFTLTKHTSFLFLVGYIILAILVCVYFNQKRTKLNWMGKSYVLGYLIQMIMLAPYFLLIFIPLYLIPVLLFLVLAILTNWFFELSLKIKKLPSPTKQLAFFVGVTVLIVKYLYAS